MNNILTTEQAIKLSKKLRNQNKTIVVVGGCFDILHIGHVTFLEKAKKQGDVLIVLLENDVTVTKLKGKDKPIFSQNQRAKVLIAISAVDYVLLLPSIWTNKDYDAIITRLKPVLIATTKGDPNRHHKERQAKLVNAKVVDVIDRIPNQSTTKLANLLLGRYK